MSPTYLPWCGCHGLATTHWILSSCGRLEAERVNQFWSNLVHNSKLGTSWQSRNQIIKFLKFKMADSRHVRKYWKCHNSPTNGPTGMKLRWSHPIMIPTCRPWCGCHGNVGCLAMAHWTFCSYGCLEAEHVNQFWWNLVHSSTLRLQWQSRDQILIFKNSKWRTAAMLENNRNVITRLSMDRLRPNLGGHITSCLRHVPHDLVAMATAVA